MGPFVAELKRFIERLKLAENDVREMGRDIIRLKQGVRDLWTEGGSPLPGADFTGQVDGCTSHGFPGAEVKIKDPSTGTVVQTFNADDTGAFSGTLAMSHGTSQVVDFEATPTGAHAAKFDGPVTLAGVTLNEGANAVGTATILPATGYTCGPTNYYPVAGSTTNFSLTVRGCNSLGVPGAGVTVTETATGTVLASGTTNSSGVFAVNPLAIPANPTAVTIAITSPITGFSNQSFSSSLANPTTTIVRVLALASASWHCLGGRWFPVPTTLQATDSVVGPFTLVWHVPTVRYIGLTGGLSFPGCGPFPANPGNNFVQHTLVNSGTSWTLNASDVSGTISSCNFTTNTSPPLLLTGSTTGVNWHCAGVNYTVTE